MGVRGHCDQWRDLYPIPKTMDAHHPWWMYKSSQVVLWVSGSKYHYRCYNPHDARESCVESTCLKDKKISFIIHFRSWSSVSNPTALNLYYPANNYVTTQDTHIRCCSTGHSNRAIKKGHGYNLCVYPFNMEPTWYTY